jgi:ADP-heptose:LPS heptosyltransferase
MQRVLVIRIDFLGDIICTTPFIHGLKLRWPNAEIHVLANKYNRAALDRNPDVAAVHTYVYSKQCERNVRPGRLHAIYDRIALIWRLRKLKFDLLIVPNGGMNKNSIQFARQLNVKDCRWHNADTEFDDRKPEQVANRPIRHEALSGFALTPELGPVDIDALEPVVYADPSLREKWAAEFGRKAKLRVGLFVCNKAASRRWSVEKWCRLAASLSHYAEVIIFCDPAEPQAAGQFTALAARCVSPATVPDLIAAMSLLDLVVTADSAPVHLSSALQLPVVALFEDRREKYQRWHPLGVPHIVLREGALVDDIGFESVERACRALLDEQSVLST